MGVTLDLQMRRNMSIDMDELAREYVGRIATDRTIDMNGTPWRHSSQMPVTTPIDIEATPWSHPRILAMGNDPWWRQIMLSPEFFYELRSTLRNRVTFQLQACEAVFGNPHIRGWSSLGRYPWRH